MLTCRLLADNVIVMQRGKIMATGAPLALKSRYGQGYRLTLACSSDGEGLGPPVASAAFESSAAGQTIWRIGDPNDIGKVVKWADETEKRREDHQAGSEIHGDVSIQGWEISMPSLEDVLLERKLF